MVYMECEKRKWDKMIKLKRKKYVYSHPPCALLTRGVKRKLKINQKIQFSELNRRGNKTK